MKFSYPLLMQFLSKNSVLLATILFLVMFGAAFFSGAGNPFHKAGNPGDSATMDEVAHIPSAYSYLKFQEYRLNPEHPPLFKDIAALPLMFMDLRFPEDHPCWSTEINGQWICGYQFLYHSGNNADAILFWSRLPMILIMVLLGALLFHWAKLLWGPIAGLVVAVIYAFSPSFISHGHYVTTDVPVAFFTALSLYTVWRFFKNPSTKTILFAGLALGFAQLTKFSAVLLIPLIAFFLVLYAATAVQKYCGKDEKGCFWKHFFRQFYKYGKGVFAIFAIAFVLIGVFYIFHVWNMAPDKISDLIYESIYIESFEPFQNILHSMAHSNIVVKAYAQYFLGVLMVLQRATGGNTAFFLGEVGNQGWWYYFPVAFFLKIPLAIHILWIVALVRGIWKSLRRHTTTKKSFIAEKAQSFVMYVQHRTAEFFMISFVVVYSVSSIQSSLNLGVRHLLPMIPLIYLLTVKQWKEILKMKKRFRAKWAMAGILVVWLVVSSLAVYPSYLSYFNEIAGGPKNGYHFITDSNYDWGQDLRRLTVWVEENNIQQLSFDYFGGGLPEYYLGDRYQEIDERDQDLTGWIAVSSTHYSVSFEKEPTYQYLLDRGELREQIGYSILIFYIPEE